MKHVVCAALRSRTQPQAPSRRCVLVTGFGAFPGARANPTAAILTRLERQTSRLARLGLDLRLVLLPVVYDEIGPVLRQAVERHRPTAVLHLGLAGRRRAVSVETRAINRAGPLHADASGRLPQRQVLLAGAPPSLSTTYPAAQILAAVRRSGIAARRSIDAGDYVCNATLFIALAGQVAPQVGFLHVPRPRSRRPIGRSARPTIEALTRAAVAAVLVTGRSRP